MALLSFFFVACSSDRRSDPPIPDRVQVYCDLEAHPKSIRLLAEHLESIEPGCTVEEFQSQLAHTALVEVPFGHFKDFEYYWNVLPLENQRPYLLTGTFFYAKQELRLAYCTINVVESRWRTIWSIDYQTANLNLSHPLRVHGVVPEK